MKFELGEVVITRAALTFCEKHKVNPLLLVGRHLAGDWGDVCKEDKQANEDALVNGDRLVSAYEAVGQKFYIITEFDRSYTTIMLREDY